MVFSGMVMLGLRGLVHWEFRTGGEKSKAEGRLWQAVDRLPTVGLKIALSFFGCPYRVASR
jgi:hypothetical protein